MNGRIWEDLTWLHSVPVASLSRKAGAQPMGMQVRASSMQLSQCSTEHCMGKKAGWRFAGPDN